MAVRQLEFILLQLIQQVDEFVWSIQSILGGRFPTTLVNPWILYNILRNVSFQLPENYELIAGSKLGNIHYYYDLIKVAVVGNTHGMKIILGIPLKSDNQHFTLYKLIVLPKRVSKDKFIKYLPQFCYIGLSVSQRDYVLLTSSDWTKCSTRRITVCPINTALCDVQSQSCEAHLFFQTTGKNGPCTRRLLHQYSTPILQRHGLAWVYNFPIRRQVAIRWPNG